MLVCLTPVCIGFFLPTGIVFSHAWNTLDWQKVNPLLTAALNTALLSTLAALLALGVAALMTIGSRTSKNKITLYLTKLASIGYAAPGAVLAVGLMMPVLFINKTLNTMLDAIGLNITFFLSGTIFILLYAYVVRFMAIPLGALDTAFGRISPSIEYAAQTLGESTGSLFRRIHFPIVKGSAITATLLVFVDTTKELPATLLLRPFNFETLATTVYNAASTEQLNDAAPAALLIVLIGLLPVFIIRKQIDEREALHAKGE
jgi:iron(III) transport system permease protein